MEVRSYRNLIVWQKAMDLVDRVYEASETFPASERFGLIQQWRRAAVSIPSNIAEGHGRDGRKEYNHHLSIAYGSLAELETQAMIAYRRNWLHIDVLNRLLEQATEIGKMINSIQRKLKAA